MAMAIHINLKLDLKPIININRTEHGHYECAPATGPGNAMAQWPARAVNSMLQVCTAQ